MRHRPRLNGLADRQASSSVVRTRVRPSPFQRPHALQRLSSDLSFPTQYFSNPIATRNMSWFCFFLLSGEPKSRPRGVPPRHLCHGHGERELRLQLVQGRHPAEQPQGLRVRLRAMALLFGVKRFFSRGRGVSLGPRRVHFSAAAHRLL